MALINPYIHFNGNAEDANQLFNGLSAGGSIEMPMADGRFGAYFGMFTDKYGVQWMVAYETAQ